MDEIKKMERTGDHVRSGPRQQKQAPDADAHPRETSADPGGAGYDGAKHGGDSHVGGSHLRGAMAHLNSMGHGHGNAHPHHTRKPSHKPDHHSMGAEGPVPHRVKR